MIKEEDILVLNQFIKTLEDSFDRLKEAYNKKDPENFNKSKRIIIQIQRRISGMAK